MVKAKEFWEYLCEELDYRFFTGVPCKGLKSLYDEMNPDFLHYVPAVNERVAIGMACGASLAGIKSGVLINADNIHVIHDPIVNFVSKYNISFLILAYSESNKKLNLGIPKSELKDNKFVNKLKLLSNKSEKLQVPGIFYVGKGVITC
jgi:sulfopyruvate decarboxylase TPP-binding subunit